jgi:CheY-like chemotaxis protein
MMPEMDGVEAAGRIRSMEGGRDAVIIALTANATGNAERKFKDAGFDGSLPNPVDPVKLEDTLRCFLRPELIETMT